MSISLIVNQMLLLAADTSKTTQASAKEIKLLLKKLSRKERIKAYRDWYETIVRIKELSGNEKYWN
jgi:hypothetical protein